ncbi:MAG: extracellular solute-binding protein [Anaerolineae bacterium]|nr:extracellular solute-binding protein [Candidatus Roseilinea sp.]MDW8449308.1 extracellular solute-binding protein [Anaerolineae bacterium]
MKASKLISATFIFTALIVSACATPFTQAPATQMPATPSPTQAAAGETSIVAGEKVKITWWTENPEEQYQQPLIENFVNGCQTDNPNIEIELKFTENLNDVLRTAVQAGSGPDIIQTPGPAFVAEYVRAGLVSDLTPYEQKFGWRDIIFPWALDVGKLDGKLYSLPLTYEAMVMWYNKKTLAANNWNVPTTRAELEKIAEEAKAKGLYPFVNGNAGWKGVNEWLVSTWYNNYAGADNVYRALKGDLRWDDTLFVEAIALLKDYMDKGYFRGGKQSYFATDFPEIEADLATGKGVFDFAGTWAFQNKPVAFTENPDDWDWAPAPSLRDGVRSSFPIGIGSTLSINAASKNPDAAAAVLHCVYSNPRRAAKIIHDFPGEWVVPITLTKEDFPVGTDPRFIRALEALAAASKSGDYGYTTWTFWPAKSDQFIIEQMDAVFDGKMTPEEFSRQLQEIYAQEAKDGKLPPVPSR